MKHERTTKNHTLLLAVMVAAAACTLSLSACNTVSGMGKDLQEASENVKQAIEE